MSAIWMKTAVGLKSTAFGPPSSDSSRQVTLLLWKVLTCLSSGVLVSITSFSMLGLREYVAGRGEIGEYVMNYEYMPYVVNSSCCVIRSDQINPIWLDAVDDFLSDGANQPSMFSIQIAHPLYWLTKMSISPLNMTVSFCRGLPRCPPFVHGQQTLCLVKSMESCHVITPST